MKEIRMVDLQAQYLKIKTEIDKAIQEVINSSAFINGPQVKRFGKNLANYLGVKHVVTCANGTDALQIALMALDLKSGDEVITPDFTFIATAEVIALLGLKPVMVDVDPQTFTLNTTALKNAISEKTKAIIPVHLFGLCANMSEILKIANEFSIPVIEDAAQSIGATYKDADLFGKSGTLGTIGCTSFFPSKNLGCFGDGGAIMTNDDALAERMQSITNHGSKVKYYNDMVGVNSRLDTVQAAVLDVKLQYLDEFNMARQKAAAFYSDRLEHISGIQIPIVPEYSDHVYHQYTIKFKGDRDKLKDFLSSKGIPAMIYYPVAMHAQKAYLAKGNFPVTDSLTNSVISLPMHTELTVEQQDYICTNIENFIKP